MVGLYTGPLYSEGAYVRRFTEVYGGLQFSLRYIVLYIFSIYVYNAKLNRILFFAKLC